MLQREMFPEETSACSCLDIFTQQFDRVLSATSRRSIERSIAQDRCGAGCHQYWSKLGLGSSEPATDGVVTIDLGRLKKTRQIDCASGWAVIAPGVTQIEFAESSSGTERIINVTASSGYISIVGNALERGVGLRHQRTKDIIGLEVCFRTASSFVSDGDPTTQRRRLSTPTDAAPHRSTYCCQCMVRSCY
ncbi:FAD-binding protein [Paraburkholderia sediminicola]|uniref:FAD-binding protein n=1 Tax=Paraburkholderia sediminicola TaxID=458836 RepID=UPI0038BC5C85